MNERQKESLSALLDNEADDLELGRLLKSWDSAPEIRAAWARYNLVQGLLHGQAMPVSEALSARVSEQVAAGASPAAPRFAGWKQGFVKMAIAASVAAVFVVVVQTNLEQPSVPSSVSREQLPPAGTGQPAPEGALFAVDPQAQQLLKEYISRIEIDEEEPPHAEHIQDSPLYRLVNELQSRQEQDR